MKFLGGQANINVLTHAEKDKAHRIATTRAFLPGDQLRGSSGSSGANVTSIGVLGTSSPDTFSATDDSLSLPDLSENISL